MSFTNKDIEQIIAKGLTIKDIESQIAFFKTGMAFTDVTEVATINNGIIQLDKESIASYSSHFEAKKDTLSLLKFVPASGAATRMFKFLYEFIREYDSKNESVNAFINKNKLKDLPLFLANLQKFPFYNQVIKQLKSNGTDFNRLTLSEKAWHFVCTMLDENELNYGNFPKGLLPFHKYKNNAISTAFEEHLYEAALYASANNNSKLHFTISERFKDRFDEEFKRTKQYVEQKTGISFNISFSYQYESTDTIAVTPLDEPFRTKKNESLLFRPSGHGALLKNLNALDADIIFIKNIDNVVVKTYKKEIAQYKKVLAGILLKLQAKAFDFLKTLENEKINNSKLSEITEFLTQKLNVKPPVGFKKHSNKCKIEYLRKTLNRPIRVCGIVKNGGEPGGGPFWVKDENGLCSLQIVESAQINQKNKFQKQILKGSTHFNPVDLVCGVRNYKGEKFNLEDYVNDKAAFITLKTKAGKGLKALELPGLWNGSMAFWNTIFVEVPIITFNPVKTVNDLLKRSHQIA